MGFRDLSMFNQALLVKQSWRISRNPESLLSKVLRGRYFRDGDFFNAHVGENSSLVWKNIIWGRDLFMEGYRWRVGNGNHIYIDQDPWIPRKGNRYPMFVHPTLKGKRVKDLILVNGEWNEGLIKNLLIPSDVEDILEISLGNLRDKDEITWNLESKGVFSVKSAYHLADNIQRSKEASGSCVSAHNSRWRSISDLNIIPKAKIGLWRIVKNLIPTKSNLICKGIDINPTYDLCRGKKDDSSHIFLELQKGKTPMVQVLPQSDGPIVFMQGRQRHEGLVERN